MSQGIAIKANRGRKWHQRLYIQLKNGSVYVHQKPMNSTAQAKLLTELSAKGNRVTLKHWNRVPDEALVAHKRVSES